MVRRSMESDETVLSDVHLFTDNLNNEGGSKMQHIPVVVSRLMFYEKAVNQAVLHLRQPRIDEDGDLDVARKWPNRTYNVITLEHTLATPLSLVGLQVWSGALLLSDFILEYGPALQGCTLLELGSGTGLCSILAAMFADKVISTDIGDEVLSLCQRNVQNNFHLTWARSSSLVPNCLILVRELDWRKEDPFQRTGQWSWQEDERITASAATILLASDVIYSDELTDALFKTIRTMFGQKINCKLFLSLEKRMNFTLGDLDVASPPYEHFKQNVAKLVLENSDSQVRWIIRQLPIDFAQRFTYQRTKYLELWEISRC